jgi:hypothetical protein
VWLPALAGRLSPAFDFRLKAEATRVVLNFAHRPNGYGAVLFSAVEVNTFRQFDA